MRPIATGSAVKGVVQCPPVQTARTARLYGVQTSGPLSARTIRAQIDPLDEDRGRTLNIYSWAVAPNGQQFMQIGPDRWETMREPMMPAETLSVPMVGTIALPVTRDLDLRGLVGTHVFIGLGQSLG